MEIKDFNDLLSQGTKRTLELYVANSERLGRAVLEVHERSTTWARDTILAPIFEAQRVTGRQILGTSMEMARKFYGLEGSQHQSPK